MSVKRELTVFIILLFCLLFSIRLSVALENTIIFSLGSGETGDIIKQECNKAANFIKEFLVLDLVFHNSNLKRCRVRWCLKQNGE